ncbi:phosphatidylserine synthase [Exiguobacterium sp. N4-1P]|uniref:phospholipase D-like domain-containing protein n=1 Tax=Exiguobacterium sp. N4-1P TaxID=2051906 RepID=UPI000B590B33|nr:phospholipase D-like domain-containing protein [Exiguobacterium sp. N4-1P]ASI36213.1 phosphatidylserine synthase [Exiguobacterium sp. N4-1P]
MNPKNFIFTAIKVLGKDGKYKYYPNKEKILVVLRSSYIRLDTTNSFYRGYDKPSGICYEHIELRVPIHMIDNAREMEEDIEDVLRYVYEDSDTHTDGKFEIRPMAIDLEDDYAILHDVHFEEIRQTIIQAIRSAKYTIWVAVAWFTDEEIYKELLIKKEIGLNIRIITSNEPTNRTLIARLENNFDLKKYPQVRFNRMHSKFCVIDLEYVLHGSYNWSFNATGNVETLATALDKDFVNKFAEKFIKLYSSVE